ncbi:hypothetical protein ACFE04_026458 [Oxalis oulophora]
MRYTTSSIQVEAKKYATSAIRVKAKKYATSSTRVEAKKCATSSFQVKCTTHHQSEWRQSARYIINTSALSSLEKALRNPFEEIKRPFDLLQALGALSFLGKAPRMHLRRRRRPFGPL